MKSNNILDFEDQQYVQVSRKVKEPKITLTREEILTIASELIGQKVDHKHILGYVTCRDGKKFSCKYNKDKQVFVMYQGNKILQAKFKTWREYSGDNACEYYDEIDE